MSRNKTLAEDAHGITPNQQTHSTNDALGDWRSESLARIRSLIKQADPEVVEEMKWVKPSNPFGVPVWSHNGIVCNGESHKEKVEFSFAKGASLSDPAGLFNSSLDGNTRRAIDTRFSN